MVMVDKYWGIAVGAFVLNVGCLIWACVLVHQCRNAYDFSISIPTIPPYQSAIASDDSSTLDVSPSSDDSSSSVVSSVRHDFDSMSLDRRPNTDITTISANKIITNAIASSILFTALLNIIASSIVFHGLRTENVCSLIWYIVLNSVALATQIPVAFAGIVLGYNGWSVVYSVDSYGNLVKKDSDLNPKNISFFLIPVVILTLVATIMIGQRRKEIRNTKISALFAAGSPQQVVVMPQGQQQVYLPQQAAPGPNQQYGTSNQGFEATKH